MTGPNDTLSGAARRLARNWSVRIGGTVLIVITLISVFAPWLGSVDPKSFDTANRDLLPGATATITVPGGSSRHTFWMGSDGLGRDNYSRVLYGGRVSLRVGMGVACLSLLFGVVIGSVAGYAPGMDAVVMRVMDGMMAIPGVLLAIALVAIWQASLWTVIVAITLTEIPRVARLVRALVLSIREEPYIEAAVSVGTSKSKILLRHILPNAIGPIIVQGTYVCAVAMLLEALLSFLGIGLSLETPSWGNVMSEGRKQFNQYPHNVLFPGFFLALTVLSVNLLGDGLRDTLDPRFSRRGER